MYDIENRGRLRSKEEIGTGHIDSGRE